MDVLPEQTLDSLIIKAPQSGTKGEISGVLFGALMTWGGAGTKTSQDVILQTGTQRRAPNVGFWSAKPTRQEFNNPLANHCPLPNVWIEIFYNDAGRDEALNKIREAVIPACGNTCCIVAIGLQRQISAPMLARLGVMGGAGAPAAAAALPGGRPHWAPYIGVWAANTPYGGARWYTLQYGVYVDLDIPQRPAALGLFRLDFDLIAACI